MTQAQVFEGLEGVLVARTELSEVEGERGLLSVRGRSIESLVGRLSFEQMLGLLLDGEPPDRARSAGLAAELGAARLRAHARLTARLCSGASGSAALATGDAMGALRTALSLLDADCTPADALGMAAVACAAWIRTARGVQLLAPEPGLPHASDLLRMLQGGAAPVSEARARLLDAYLVTVAEHGFNASSFAARVAASTGADLASAMLAGVATLSGPLHGGAPGPVLDMLDAVGTPARAAEYVRAELAAGRRIMGMGHRVYRVRDPRAYVLERALLEYRREAGSFERLELLRAVEAAAEAELSRKHPERALKANVELYTALLLEALDLPRAAFTSVFACARCAGYAAHYAEQRRTGRLIRPSALYVGSAAS